MGCRCRKKTTARKARQGKISGTKAGQLTRFAGGSLLYWLLYRKLYLYFSPFRIFRYLTFRTAFASLTALLITLIIGPYVIEKLR